MSYFATFEVPSSVFKMIIVFTLYSGDYIFVRARIGQISVKLVQKAVIGSVAPHAVLGDKSFPAHKLEAPVVLVKSILADNSRQILEVLLVAGKVDWVVRRSEIFSQEFFVRLVKSS